MLVNFVQLPSFFILSLCLSPYFSLMPSPSCLLHLTLHPIPRTRLQVEAPRLRRNLTPYLLPPMLFFFSHSNFPFQSYRPGHTNPPKSILVLLSYLYYLPHWSPLLLFLLSEYLLSSLSHHSSPPALSFPHVFVPPMGKVNFCPLSLTPVGIRTVCLQP